MRDLLAPDDTRDALRKHGGLLLGLGVLMLVLRRAEDSGNFLNLVLFAAMAAYLYAAVFSDRFTNGVRPWAGVHSVFGLLFIPLALFELIDLIGDSGDSGNNLNVFWVFGVTAAAAFYAGVVKGIRFHLLAGAIATIIAWTALWSELLGDEGVIGHFNIYRGLLGILAILFLGGALYLWRENRDAHVVNTGVTDGGDHGLWKASELLTGAGLAAILACGGLTAGSAIVGEFVSELFGGLGASEFEVIETNHLWDILLLVVSLGLIGLGSTIGTRGPVYVGAIGLALFLYVVGGDLNEGKDADPSNVGLWPWILIALGALAAGLSFVKEASQGDKPSRLVRRLRNR